MKSNNHQDIWITPHKFFSLVTQLKFCQNTMYGNALTQRTWSSFKYCCFALREKNLTTCPTAEKALSLLTRKARKHRLQFKILPSLQHYFQQMQKCQPYCLESSIFHSLFFSPKYCYFLCIFISIFSSQILNISKSGGQREIKLSYSCPEALPERTHTCQEEVTGKILS